MNDVVCPMCQRVLPEDMFKLGKRRSDGTQGRAYKCEDCWVTGICRDPRESKRIGNREHMRRVRALAKAA